MSHPVKAIAPGLAEPVADAQRVFRVILGAMARPGHIAEIPGCPEPPSPMSAGTAALALALIDFETPIWLDAAGSDGDAVKHYLRFHCGCRVVEQPGEARFAIVADGEAMPPLSIFDVGTLENPDRSTTVFIQVKALDTGMGTSSTGIGLRGPGIADEARLVVDGLHADFWQWASEARALFPCGIDVVLVAGNRIAALPRSTKIGN